MGLKHDTLKSFLYAFQGLHSAYKNEPNLAIHTFIGAFVILTAAILGVGRIEWLILIFTIFWVISLELLNTVLEAIVNLVSPDIKPYAKIAKDVSAACVLLAALMSIIVGFFIFIPRIIIFLQK